MAVLDVDQLSPRARQQHARRQLVEQARTLMRERLAADSVSEEVLSLPAAAQALFISPRQLQRAFAEAGSPGFCHELTALRVQKASELLRAHPKRSVATTARAVGYRQPSYFAKAFRSHMGVSPGEFRRQVRRESHRRTASEHVAASLLVAAA